jgi:hypothetical protein
MVKCILLTDPKFFKNLCDCIKPILTCYVSVWHKSYQICSSLSVCGSSNLKVNLNA